jgi:rod shape-determining protein MreB
LLPRLDERIAASINIPVSVVDDPLTAVARGTGVLIEDFDRLRGILILNNEQTLN